MLTLKSNDSLSAHLQEHKDNLHPPAVVEPIPVPEPIDLRIIGTGRKHKAFDSLRNRSAFTFNYDKDMRCMYRGRKCPSANYVRYCMQDSIRVESILKNKRRRNPESSKQVIPHFSKASRNSQKR